MLRTQCRPVRSLFLMTLMLGAASTVARAQNIDPANDGSKFAWGENVGWVNFQPMLGPQVTVTDSAMTGFAWGENIGWINLNPASSGGVVNDGAGHLSGFAWGENVGWINFAPIGGGVFIDACGEFNGTAWGENIGWISFRSTGAFPFKITTSWVTPIDATAPLTSATGARLGWNRTDVSVTLSATDCGAGVQEVRYTLDSDPEVIVPGSSAIVNISSEGVHSLSYFSVDTAGNRELTTVLSVRIDKTAPVITISSPSDGATFVQNQNVAADFVVSDSVSGVAGVLSTAADGSRVATSTTGAKTFIVTAFDHAGNSTSVTHTYSIVAAPLPIITTFAGGGTVYGDGGPATDAILNGPAGIAIDAAGNVYVADPGTADLSGNPAPGSFVVRRIDGATGVITTAAGNGVFGDCVGSFYFSDLCGDGGPATEANLSTPFGIAVDLAGNLYIADFLNSVIRKVDVATGIITKVAGGASPVFGFDGDGGPAIHAVLFLPQGVAVDAAGNIYIADTANLRVRKVDAATGIIDTIAGSEAANIRYGGSGGDGGPALLAGFTSVQRVALDLAGNVYVLDGDGYHARVRRIDATTGIITTVAGGGTGTGESGPATEADVLNIVDIALDSAGNLYMAGAGRVWRVDAAGNISVFAGTGNWGFSGDGGPAIAAELAALGGIGVAGNGDVYISDSAAPGRVRRVTAAVVVPPPDVIIDAATSQSALDALTDVPGSLVIVNTARSTLLMPNLTSVGNSVIITNNPVLTTVNVSGLTTAGTVTISGNTSATTVNVSGLTTAGTINISGNTSATTVDVSSLTTAGTVTISGNTSVTTVNVSGLTTAGTVTITDNAAATTVDVGALQSVGDLTITNNDAAAMVDVGSLQSVAGSVTITDNAAATTVDVGALQTVGGDVTISNNDAAATVNVGALQTVGGHLTITDNDAAATVDVGALQRVGGNVNIAAGGTSVRATTGGGTTRVSLVNSPATMTAVLPAGSFTSSVRFSIQSLGAQPPSDGLDAGSNPVVVSPIAAYQFAFDIPTLNLDATLIFDIDVAALGAAGAAEFLEALSSDSATLGVRGDAPDSVFQTFAVCVAGQLPAAGGCVAIERFDATGAPLPAGDPTVPATVRFTGITGHFSTFAVVIVSPFDTTPPVISGVPGDIVAEATSPAGAVVTYAVPTAVDDRDGSVAVNCTPASGSTFSFGPTTVTCTATDAAGNSSIDAFTVTVQHTTPVAVNDAITVAEDSSSNLVNVMANDSDVDGDTLSVTAAGAASHGTVGFSAAGVTYTPAPNYFGSDTFAYTVDDGHGGSATATVSVLVTAVNDAPVNSVPGPQATRTNLPLLLSTSGGNPLSIADVDAGTNPLRVTLGTNNGTLTLASRTGLTFVGGDGIADATMTFTGTIATISAAFNGMFFTPRFGFSGAASLTIATNDQGYSGTGGQLSDSDTVPITVGPAASADLAVTMTDAPDPVSVGSNLTYSIQVKNNGPFPATTVTVVDVLPATMTFVSAATTQGACTFVNALRTVRCDLGSLANKGAASVTIVARPTQGGTLTDRAIVGANQSDPNAANNTATVQTVVR